MCCVRKSSAVIVGLAVHAGSCAGGEKKKRKRIKIQKKEGKTKEGWGSLWAWSRVMKSTQDTWMS